MKNLFYSLMVCLVTCTMVSCGGNSNYQKYLEDSIKQLNEQLNDQEDENDDYSSNNSTSSSSDMGSADNSSSSSSSSQSKPSGSLKEKAYNKGYDRGMSYHAISLDYYTKDNEKQLKDLYMADCRISAGGLSPENYNNRALYEEFRKGFMKGYEDGNNAL